jgi:hypothetical protein
MSSQQQQQQQQQQQRSAFEQQLASSLQAAFFASNRNWVNRQLETKHEFQISSTAKSNAALCGVARLRENLTGQMLYSIVGMDDPNSAAAGCQIMGCGDDQFYALGLPPRLRVSPASAQPDDDDESSIHDTMLPVLNTYASVQSIRAIAAGGMHSVALTTNGVPYTWGNPDDQALGRSLLGRDPNDPTTTVNTNTKPCPVVGFVSPDGHNDDGQIYQVAAGEAHTHFVALGSGQVYSAGTFRDVDANTIRIVPSELIADGRYVVPISMPGPVFSVHSNNNISAAILKDGTLVTWGKCDCMHALVFASWIACKWFVSTAACFALHCHETGFGNNGELARSAGMTDPDENGNFDVSAALYKDATTGEIDHAKVLELFLKPKHVEWNVRCQPKLPRRVIAVGLGHYHILVAARDGGSLESQVYASGLNGDGQLGLGDDVTCHALTHVSMRSVFGRQSTIHHEHFSHFVSFWSRSRRSTERI